MYGHTKVKNFKKSTSRNDQITIVHTFDKVEIKFSRLHVGKSDVGEVIWVICFVHLHCEKHNKVFVSWEKHHTIYWKDVFKSIQH